MKQILSLIVAAFFCIIVHAQNADTKLSNDKTLKAVKVSGSGKGDINVDASTLSSGAYQYSLIVDGKLFATKQMVIAK